MKRILSNRSGEGTLSVGVKIIIAVVVGALVLGGLFALWKTVLLPKMQTRVEDMMDVDQNTAVQIRCVANDSGASVLEYSYDGNTWLSVPMTNFSADAEIKAYCTVAMTSRKTLRGVTATDKKGAVSRKSAGDCPDILMRNEKRRIG